jgi:putative transcriptional regulator
LNAVLCRYRGERDREPLHVPYFGLDYIYLLSGYTRHETKHGPGTSFNDSAGAHRVIGHYLANLRRPLTGKELRFLRVEMDIPQVELGRLLHLSDQQVARWEKGVCEISGAAEVLFRCIYLQHLGCKLNVREFAEQRAAADGAPVAQVLLKSKENWELTCAS